ncbi:MAG: hypothetical protein MJ221_03215 [Bacilli bacterium]|nr:hypothetical protein [Bacilli bacterium]
MIDKFFIDTHTTPASVFKVVFDDSNSKRCKKYSGNNKWVDADISELERLVQIGSARQVEDDVVKEFKLDLDKNFD